MRLNPDAKAVLLSISKVTGWSEAKVANLLIVAGADAVDGKSDAAKKTGVLVDAAVAAHKVNVKADALKAEANASVRKAAAALKPSQPVKVTAKALDKKD